MERPLKGFVSPVLALSYQPREYLTIGRIDRPPDADDIAQIVALARESFIIVTCEPQRKIVSLTNGIAWYLARWSLQRESVAEYLPQRTNGGTDEPEYQPSSPEPLLLRII
jgi:hypothetical protein